MLLLRGSGSIVLVRGGREGWVQRLRWGNGDDNLGRLGHDVAIGLPGNVSTRYNVFLLKGDVLANLDGNPASGLLGLGGFASLRNNHGSRRREHMRGMGWNESS